MRYRIFGEHTGLKVSELCLGTGMFGGAWGYGADPADVKSALRTFADAGGNFIDSADNYQHGESETAIGEFIAPNRDDYVIVSKYSRAATGGPALAKVGNARKNMVQSVEDSLRRLKTDHIDIYLAHMDDQVTPMEEIARGFDDLVRAGKIVYGGLSNFPAWRVATAAKIAELRGWAPITGIQVEYSLLQRTTEREILPMAEGYGLGVMAWSPMAGGLLSDKYRRGEVGRATRFPHIVRHNDPARVEPVIDELIAIAEEVGATAGQVAVAWVSAKGVFPVVGVRAQSHIEAHLGSLDVKLTDAHIQRLDAKSAVPPGYPHELLAEEGQRAVMGAGRWQDIDFPERVVA